jgi:excisionase family DNA binding protein
VTPVGQAAASHVDSSLTAVGPSPGRAPRNANTRSTPTLALSIEEACVALGLSWDTWREYVAPEIRIVRCGRRKLVAVAELERWLAERGEKALDG